MKRRPPSGRFLELRTVGELQPDDAGNDDREPECLHQRQGLVEKDGACRGRADGADACPYSVADSHIDGPQGGTQEIECQQEE